MNRRHAITSASIGAIAAAALFAGVAAADSEDHEQARALVESGEVLPLEELLRRTRTAIQGRLLDVELEEKHGRWVYEIEWLEPGGRVRESAFDAKSGEPLK